jgi:hypothetical protein
MLVRNSGALAPTYTMRSTEFAWFVAIEVASTHVPVLPGSLLRCRLIHIRLYQRSFHFAHCQCAGHLYRDPRGWLEGRVGSRLNLGNVKDATTSRRSDVFSLPVGCESVFRGKHGVS